MDDWVVLGGLLVLALLMGIVLGSIAFFRLLGLPQRLEMLERRLIVLTDALRTRQGEALTAPPVMLVPKPAPPQSVRDSLPEDAATEPPPSAPERPESVPHTGRLPPISAKKPVRSLEERLGAGWTVWVGGLALALGALLLVRYSIEMGLIGPGFRVLAGLALAALLAVAGEALRRRERDSDKRGDIPAVLTAAGTVAALGAIYAAHALYGFIGPAAAFGALGLTGIACMALAALHGPWLAGLGLVGALAVPLLVTDDHAAPWAVAIYTAIVIAAAYGLMRLRDWLWVGLAAALGAGVWGLALAVGADGPAPDFFHAGMAHACLHIGLAGLAFGQRARQPIFSGSVPSLLTVPAIAVLLAGTGRYFGLDWVIWAGVPVILLALVGRLQSRASGALLAAALTLLAIMLIWPESDARPALPFPPLWLAMPLNANWFAAFSGVLAGIVAIVASSGLLAGVPASRRAALIQAGTTCITPLAALALVWLRLQSDGNASLFAAIASLLALAFIAMATLLRPRQDDAAWAGLGCFSAAALAALSLGLVFILDRGMLTVALALAAAGTGLVVLRLNIPALRWCVVALGLIIAARLAWDPRIAGAGSGTTPVFNWLLFGYGVPAASFAFAALCLRDRTGREDVPLRLSQSLAIVFSALLVFFEIRHALNHGDPFAKSSSLVEQGLFSVSALGFAIITTRLNMARAGPVYHYASLGFGLLSFGTTLIGLGFFENPFFTDEAIEGGRFFNALLLAYAMPGALALFLSKLSRGVRPEWYRLGAAFVALLLLFATASLEVRRWFMASQIGFLRGFQDVEWYAYSLVWLLMGLFLLGYGIWRASHEARLVSALFVLAAVLKIFIFDLAGLDGVLRALSFIGLGFVLIGIGLVYQKLVFNPGNMRMPNGQ